MSPLPLLTLLACVKPVAPTAPGEPLTADAALTTARAHRTAGLVPVVARFSIRIATPTTNLSASGALLVSPPDRFRIEISGPIGPPQLVVASDGASIHAWHAGPAVFYQGTDAGAALEGLTGGAAGLDVVTALLLGQYADPATDGLSAAGPVAWPEPPAAGVPQWRWTWCATSGACVTEGVAEANGHLVALAARTADRELLTAVVTPGAVWPSAMEIDLPPIGTHAEVTFQSWKPAAPPDTAFVLAPPPGATIKPLAVGTAATPPGASSTP